MRIQSYTMDLFNFLAFYKWVLDIRFLFLTSICRCKEAGDCHDVVVCFRCEDHHVMGREPELEMVYGSFELREQNVRLSHIILPANHIKLWLKQVEKIC